MLNSKIIIKIIFKIIGAAAASANLLWELSIAEKKDAKDTTIKNGMVILVRFMARFIFSLSSINPGAIMDTNEGINICTIKTNISRIKNKKLKTSLENLLDLLFPLTISEE